LIKYASNAFLATKISFINELANLCDRVQADVHHVAKGMGLDRRIGSKFLHPGPGFGGSCFPKDTSALVEMAKKNDYEFKIVKATLEVNRQQRQIAFEKIKTASGSLKGKTVGILGLSFKPNTDDLRDAKDADVLVFMTEWNQFRKLDINRLKKLMRTPTIVDLRNIYEPEKMNEYGFKYVAVGR
jgi:UDPglucose 6-dehydrogenase